MMRLRARCAWPPVGLSLASHVLFLLWTLILVAALPDARAWLLLSAVFALGGVLGGHGERILLNRRLWLFILATLALSPFILEEPDVCYAVVCFSRAGFWMGVWMAARAMALMLAVGSSFAGLSISRLMLAFDALGWRGLGFALGVALNLGAILPASVEAAYHTIRLRGGFRRPVQAARLFLVTVIANALRYGDDVIKAAWARAFDPAARPNVRPAPRLAWPDALFAAVLALVGGALLWPF